jgi:hypothetical protein
MLTMDLHSAIKKYEIMSFSGKWMELEDTMLSKISQTEKYYKFAFTYGNKPTG